MPSDRDADLVSRNSRRTVKHPAGQCRHDNIENEIGSGHRVVERSLDNPGITVGDVGRVQVHRSLVVCRSHANTVDVEAKTKS